MGQGTLNSWDGGVDADETDETPRGNGQEDGTQNAIRADVQSYKMMADNAEPFADDSCPWCCAPADDFTTELSSGDSVACGNCSASIPVDSEWYQNGEKIII